MKKTRNICALALCMLMAACAGNTENQEVDPVDGQENVQVSAKEPVFSISFIPQSIRENMIGKSMPASGAKVGFDDLRYLRLSYVNFDGEDCVGEMICNKIIADDVMEIFKALYEARYQIATMRLIDEFNGSDDESMAADNTSSFNYRVIAGSKNLSRHAYGLAIDINPVENPYVNSKNETSPPAAVDYIDRNSGRPHMIDKNDLCYKLFIKKGFTWGGDWSHPDYQHFQYPLPEKKGSSVKK